jgi:hypothetical protein
MNTPYRTAVAAVVAVLAWVVTTGAGTIGSAAVASWPAYHGDNLRSGFDSADPTYSSIAKSWSASLDGAEYASPIVVGSVVVAATENNSVYAFSTQGAQLWRTNLGAPVPQSSLPCGDIDPVGITSTPVADPATNTVFVVAFLSSPSLHYQLVALNLANGAVAWQTTLADSAQGFNPSVQNQRGALTLANGNIYVPFGGRAGDCGSYYGWVMSFPESGSGSLTSVHLPEGSDHEGGLWQPAGGSADSSGDLYYTSGNTCCSGTYEFGETVVKFSPTLSILDYFFPSNWQSLDASDADLGSTGPLLLPGGAVFQVGKAGVGYLLSQTSLGGTSHNSPLFSAQVCPGQSSDAAFGGDAFDGSYIYVPCTDGVVALSYDQANHTFAFAWQATGVYGPPIVAGGEVWVDAGGYLYGLKAGQTVFKLALGSSSSHFGTPAALDNEVFVPATSMLVAFDAVSNSWVPEPGTASDVAAGGGQTFVIGTNAVPGGYGIYSWSGSSWSAWPGGGTAVAVDSSGRPWVVNDTNQIWHWNGSTWLQAPGKAHYVAAGSDGSVYALGTNAVPGGYGIWAWNGSQWTAVDGGLVDISVGTDGSVWGSNDSEQIWRLPAGGAWSLMPGAARDVAATNANSASVIGTDARPGGYGVWTWNGTAWTELQGAAVDIAAQTSTGELWAVNSSNAIYG